MIETFVSYYIIIAIFYWIINYLHGGGVKYKLKYVIPVIGIFFFILEYLNNES